MKDNNKQFSAAELAMLLGTDAGLLVFDFRPGSQSAPQMIGSRAGFLPDYSEERLQSISRGKTDLGDGRKRVGLFADEMPQTIVTRVYNYQLDYIVLCGDESEDMISNLRRTLIPDIAKEICIVHNNT